MELLVKIIVLCCLMFACSQTSVKNTIPYKSDLYQHWIHSYEDDIINQEHRTYRPATFPFPPARGREGFEIKENGVFVSYPIAPVDGNLTIKEKWTLNNDELTVTGKTTTNKYKIISLTKEKLVLKPAK